MLFLFWLSFLISFISAFKLDSKKCALELQGIIHRPVTYESQRMERVISQFPVEDPALWTIDFNNPTNPAFETMIMDYLVRYNLSVVFITFQDGSFVAYCYVEGTPYHLVHNRNNASIYPLNWAQANLNLGGFVDLYPTKSAYDYSIIAFGPSSKFVYITIEYKFSEVTK